MIGVLDSGVGGLSVLPALQRALPSEPFVYVADSGHAPYGDKSPAFLLQRAEAIFDFFLAQGVQAVVLACNTLSVACAAALRQRYPQLPIVAMEPAIKPAVEQTRTGTVLVLATAGTVYSASVARLCQQYGTPGKRILLQACPGWVEHIERGDFDSPALRHLIAGHLSSHLVNHLQPAQEPEQGQGVDTIVLGCTHYAFVAPVVAELAGPGVQLIETSEAIARQLRRVYAAPQPSGVDPAQQPPASRRTPTLVLYTTGSAPALRHFVQRIALRCDAVHAVAANLQLVGVDSSI